MSAALLTQPGSVDGPDYTEMEAATVAHKLELLREVRRELDRELKDGHARLALARRAAAEAAGPLVPPAAAPNAESSISLPFIAGFATGGFAVLLVRLALG